jgi:hypothetical protein
MARKYLRHNVVEGRGVDNGEAEQEHIRLGIRQRSEAVVVFLSGCVPQAEPHTVIVEHHICIVALTAGKTVSTTSITVIKGTSRHIHSRNVLVRKVTAAVADKQTGLQMLALSDGGGRQNNGNLYLADSTVPDGDTLFTKEGQ